MKRRGYIVVKNLTLSYHKVDVYFDNILIHTLYGISDSKLLTILNIINKLVFDDAEKFKFNFIRKFNTYKPLENIDDISNKIALFYKEYPEYDYCIDTYVVEPPIKKWINQYPNIICDIYNGKYAISLLSKKTDIEHMYNIQIDKMFISPLGKIYITKKVSE
jgi:hypothetical protein